MHFDPRIRSIQLLSLFLLAGAVWIAAASALAVGPAESSARDKADLEPVQRHLVGEGDSLSDIAASYGVRVEDLVEINDLENPDRILAGTEILIPGDPKNGMLTRRGVRLAIPEGFTLTRISEIYGVPVSRIVRANGIENPDRVRAGRKLLVPGADRVRELVPPPPCYRGAVTLYRVRTDVTREVPLCFCDGRANPDAVEIISEISAPPRMEEPPFPLHTRLLVLLQKIAEHWPGKRIEIISGQRVGKSDDHESYHNKGRALDFRVAGVGNRELAWFVRRFDNVGVGYYPNSVFIHMDVRDSNAWWVDYSRPGEKPIYRRAGLSDEELAEIRIRRNTSQQS
ncbi:MAG: LysM peptidoglycan-binding domain-containing protein [Polyangia bacterium]